MADLDVEGAAIGMGWLPWWQVLRQLRTIDKQTATAGVPKRTSLPTRAIGALHVVRRAGRTRAVAAKIAAQEAGRVREGGQEHRDEVLEFRPRQTQIDNTVTRSSPSCSEGQAAVDTYSPAVSSVELEGSSSASSREQVGKATADIKKAVITAGDQAVVGEGRVQITERDGNTTTLRLGGNLGDPHRAAAVYSYNHDANISIETDLKSASEPGWTALEQAVISTPSSLRSAPWWPRSRCEVTPPSTSADVEHPGAVPAA